MASCSHNAAYVNRRELLEKRLQPKVIWRDDRFTQGFGACPERYPVITESRMLIDF
jgi:hypothetical protein